MQVKRSWYAAPHAVVDGIPPPQASPKRVPGLGDRRQATSSQRVEGTAIHDPELFKTISLFNNTHNTTHNQHNMPRRRRPPRPGALADLSPSRIIKQIALLQVFYYGVAIVLIVFTTFVAGRHPETKAILDWRELRGDVTTGWTLALCWLLGSLITYVTIRRDTPCSITNKQSTTASYLFFF